MLFRSDKAIKDRQDWLSWVGWTSTVFKEVGGDKAELANMIGVRKKLMLAMGQIGNTPEKNSLNVPKSDTELFVGGHLEADGRIALYAPGGKVVRVSPTGIEDGNETIPTPAALKKLLGKVMKKLLDEESKDLQTYPQEFADLDKERSSTQSDLNAYNDIFRSNGDPNYEVDYGTDTLSVSQAISLTEKDLSDIDVNRKSLEKERDRQTADVAALTRAVSAWSD